MSRKSNILIATIATILGACSGGGGDGGDSSNNTPVPDPVNISGAAVKGIITNGIVSVYGVTNGVVDAEPLITGTTDSNGAYSLSVTDYSGPVVVEVSAGDNTQMVCDVVSGCNGIDFGQLITLTEDFSLQAIVPSVEEGDAVTTNVTLLTSMAAELVQTNGNISEQSAQEANSQLANVFNITGNLTELPIVDITDPAALESSNSEAKQAAMISAAILTEGLQSGSTINEALSTVVESFSDHDGQMIRNESTDNSSVISLVEIYSNVQQLIDAPVYDDIDFGTLNTDIGVLISIAQSAPSDTLTDAQSSTPELDNSVAIGRAMVSDVRTAGLAATYNDTQALAFGSNFTSAADLASAEVNLVFEATNDALEALVNAMEAFSDDNSLTSFTSEKGIDVTFNGNDQYSVTADIEVFDEVFDFETGNDIEVSQGTVSVDISITGTISVSEIETITMDDGLDNQFTYEEILDSNFDVDISVISGTASTSEIQLTINSASQVRLMLAGYETYNSVLDADEEDFPAVISETSDQSIEVAQLTLNIILEQLTGQNPTSFEGEVNFSGSDIVINEEGETTFALFSDCTAVNGVISLCNVDASETNILDFTGVSFGLSGVFSQGGSSFSAVLMANLDSGPNQIFVDEKNYSTEADFSDDYSLIGNVGNWSFDETEQNYVTGEISLALTLNLVGVDDAAEVLVSADRTGFSSGTVSVELAYNGDRLIAEISLDNELLTLVITDQNSNTFTLTETPQGLISGSIVVDGEEIATISEENDVLIIRYENGTVESV